MSKSKPLVGFDRYIEREWLDQTATWVIDGKTAKEVNALIDEYLDPLINGATSQRKTKNVLSGAWVKSLEENTVYKQQAKALYVDASTNERLAIHYGMIVASYPFFFSLSKILGRLFKLQDEVTNKEFYRRVIETIGDRDSIKRAAARYLQSMVEWELLMNGEKSSVKPAKKLSVDNPELVTWLYTAIFFAHERDKLSTDDIVSDPVWFPFEINSAAFHVPQSGVVEVVHQGVSGDLLGLKNNSNMSG